MTDITIEDLKATAEAAAGASSGEESSNDSGGSSDADTTAEEPTQPRGEWLVDLYDRLEESGKLDRILFGDEGGREVEEIQAEQAARDGAGAAEIPAPEDYDPGAAPAPQRAPDGGQTEALEMDADRLKSLMLEIYDNSGMIPGLSDDPTLSEMIKLVDSQPAVVNRMIEQRL